MFKLLEEAWGKDFTIAKDMEPCNFKFQVISATMESLLKSDCLHFQTLRDKLKFEQKFTEYETIQATYKTFEFSSVIHFQKSSVNYWRDQFKQDMTYIYGETKVKIEKQAFSEGATSRTYRMYDVDRKKMMVCKMSKNQFKGYDEMYQQAMFKFFSSAYCFQLARIFRTIFKNEAKIPPIFYATPYLYTLKTPFKGVEFLYVEPNIDFEGKRWQKFTDNFTTSMNDFLASFTHFTYAVTAGYLMVTDIQGVYLKGSYFLSDPAILCADKDHFPDPTNKGPLSMYAFFEEQHPKCSFEVCQRLNITTSRLDFDTDKIPHEKEFYAKFKEKNRDGPEVAILCFYCDHQRAITPDSYSSDEFIAKMICKKCKIASSIPERGKCLQCLSYYEFDPFLYLKLKRQFPTLCSKCRKEKFQNCTICGTKLTSEEQFKSQECHSCKKRFPKICGMKSAESFCQTPEPK